MHAWVMSQTTAGNSENELKDKTRIVKFFKLAKSAGTFSIRLVCASSVCKVSCVLHRYAVSQAVHDPKTTCKLDKALSNILMVVEPLNTLHLALRRLLYTKSHH